MFSLVDLDWIAITIATAAYFVLGGIWFSPIAFEKLWDSALGFQRDPGWRAGPIYYVVPLVGCFVASTATAILMRTTQAHGFAAAIGLGLTVAIGYASSVSSVNAVSPMTPRPIVLGVLTGAYHVTGIVLVAIVIAARQ